MIKIILKKNSKLRVSFSRNSFGFSIIIPGDVDCSICQYFFISFGGVLVNFCAILVTIIHSLLSCMTRFQFLIIAANTIIIFNSFSNKKDSDYTKFIIMYEKYKGITNE